MPANDENGTTEPETTAATPATAGAATAPDPVTVLTSRISGLDAKVSTLLGAAEAAEARAKAAEAKLSDYESGKVGADEALRAQLVAEQARTRAAEEKAQLNLYSVKFPETYAVFGAAIATLSEDVLAASEARLRGAVVEIEDAGPPTPRVHNESKTTNPSGGARKEPTAADIKAQIESLTLGPEWSPQG
jgi:hypothetical protein